MSTKIYNGIKLTKMNLQGLRHFAARLREQIAPIHLELYCKAVADLCTLIIDDRKLLGNYDYHKREEERYSKSGSKSPLSMARWNIYERQRAIKRTQERDPEVDFDFSISILPIRGKTLAIPYTEQSKFLEALNAMPEVSEYGYWNNVDEPDNVTAKEWSKRKKDWNEALPGIGIPSENGFSIDLTSDFRIMCNAEVVLQYIPSIEDRIRRRSRQAAIDDLFESFKKESDLGMDFRPWEALRKATEYLKTDAGQVKLEEWTKVITLMIQPITVETLLDRGDKDEQEES